MNGQVRTSRVIEASAELTDLLTEPLEGGSPGYYGVGLAAIDQLIEARDASIKALDFLLKSRYAQSVSGRIQPQLDRERRQNEAG